MTDTNQPEALRLALMLDGISTRSSLTDKILSQAAAELRRGCLHQISEPAQPGARWYMVNKDGAATLCTGREDAEQEAADAQAVWPRMGPHRAVQLVEAQTEGWVSVEDARKPEPGKVVIFWVYAERHGEDDDGRPFVQDASGLHMGEWRVTEHGSYFDCHSTPFADVEGVTHWMDPAPPSSAGKG